MRTGLFCTFDNPACDYRTAYADQIELALWVEAQGFDELWVAEHHFNPDASSPSSLMVLAHLAAATRRIRLGSAAVLLPLRDPIAVAEEVAMLDILSRGRFDFGVGKGGPFPVQNKHFGLRKEDSRPKTLEALALIERLLQEDVVSFEGRFFKAQDIRLVPKPMQNPLPVFLATSTDDMAMLAGARSYGLMGGPPFPLAAAKQTIAAFKEAAPQSDPNYILIRFFHLAQTAAQAVEEARRQLAGFAERMRAATAQLQPEWAGWFDIDRLIEESLIGTPDEVGEKIARIAADLSPASLVLKPMSPSLAKRKQDLALFAEKIRPEILMSRMAARGCV